MGKRRGLIFLALLAIVMFFGVHAVAGVNRVEPRYFKDYDELAEMVTDDFFNKKRAVWDYDVKTGSHRNTIRSLTDSEFSKIRAEVIQELKDISCGKNPYKPWVKIKPSPQEPWIEGYNTLGYSGYFKIYSGGSSVYGSGKLLQEYSITIVEHDGGEIDFIIVSPKGKTGIYIFKK